MADNEQGHGLQRYHFDSFARSLRTTVVACHPVPEGFTFDAEPHHSGGAGKAKGKGKGKKGKKGTNGAQDTDAPPADPLPTHIVRLADTVLFAEGGGQPYDKGTINGDAVVRVLRAANAKQHQQSADQAEVDDTLPLHFVCVKGTPPAAGDDVEVTLDWDRRFYHMQQHSAQHLISAIAERQYKWKTTSWWLGADKSNIEFLAEDESIPVTPERIRELEEATNSKICGALPVEVTLSYENEGSDSSDADGQERKSTARHQGRATRVVAIEGGKTDSNQCCGTHVSNTAQLQCVKLLGSEPARGQVRVFFVAGAHAMALFDAAIQRETAMTATVCTRPEDHVRLVSRTFAEHRAMSRQIKGLMAEIAAFEATLLIADFSSEAKMDRVVSLHREVGDMAFAGLVATTVTDAVPDAVCFITCGNEPPKGPTHPQEGIFLVACNKKNTGFDLQSAGKAVSSVLKGRGGGRAPRYQGKSPDVRLRNQALEALRATFVVE
mmetsp:Transcript_19785/g.75854  ORF Transcript_19785/g.75854 Transcript_19785/m.75854 type:complete len:494 (+) Transcript_19785:40-1521(+)